MPYNFVIRNCLQKPAYIACLLSDIRLILISNAICRIFKSEWCQSIIHVAECSKFYMKNNVKLCPSATALCTITWQLQEWQYQSVNNFGKGTYHCCLLVLPLLAVQFGVDLYVGSCQRGSQLKCVYAFRCLNEQVHMTIGVIVIKKCSRATVTGIR